METFSLPRPHHLKSKKFYKTNILTALVLLILPAHVVVQCLTTHIYLHVLKFFMRSEISFPPPPTYSFSTAYS
jgi:hypothetical protein